MGLICFPETVQKMRRPQPAGMLWDSIVKADGIALSIHLFRTWNFTKFVIDRKGNVVKRLDPAGSMDELESLIESLLRGS